MRGFALSESLMALAIVSLLFAVMRYFGDWSRLRSRAL
ncbi:MAG: prepilin-type N-terminal cleavage/methylation domain-containing protein [Pseudomonadota bacterium]|nr:prepilin-type N-terminal cleavage/methylation domain-containing protein [Pseudomonadota bacterium]